jgi:hypothetical protein
VIPTVADWWRLGEATVAGGWLDRLGVHGVLLLIGLGLISGRDDTAGCGGWHHLDGDLLPGGPRSGRSTTPFVDDHFVYAIVLVGLILANAGRSYGLGKVWQRFGYVQDRRYLY